MNKSSQEMDPWISLQDLVIGRRFITFCGGYVKSLVYVDKPQSIAALEY